MNKYVNFIRFGDLNLIRQKGYTTDLSSMKYHTPPSRYGVYAFPEYSVDLFLISGDYTINKCLKLKTCINELSYKDDCNELISTHRKIIKKYISNKNIRLKHVHDYFQRQCINYSCDDCDLECDSVPIIRFTYGHKSPKRFKYRKSLWHHLDVKETDIIDRRGEWVHTEYNVWLTAYKQLLSYEKNYFYRNRIKYSKDHHEVFISNKI